MTEEPSEVDKAELLRKLFHLARTYGYRLESFALNRDGSIVCVLAKVKEE